MTESCQLLDRPACLRQSRFWWSPAPLGALRASEVMDGGDLGVTRLLSGSTYVRRSQEWRQNADGRRWKTGNLASHSPAWVFQLQLQLVAQHQESSMTRLLPSSEDESLVGSQWVMGAGAGQPAAGAGNTAPSCLICRIT